MSQNSAAEPGDFDAQLRAAVEVANIPALLLVVAHLTGDRSWLEPPFRPGPTRGLDPNDDGGLPPAEQARIRRQAVEAIAAHRAAGRPAPPELTDDELVAMLGVSMGETVPDGYAEMIRTELGLDGGRPAARPAAAKVPRGFTAVVIGAGASGICAAICLREAGIETRIVERNDRIGGVWHENVYPGAGVDTPSHLYCYSFAPNDWSRYFAPQAEIRDYFERVARENGLDKIIEFGTEMIRAEYDSATEDWVLELERDGRTETRRANIVISAVGAFNKPKWLAIPGLDSFAGPMPHTARWPEDLSLEGRRVAVIGNGASAMQLVPAVADLTAHLTVFQRSRQWAAPFAQFRKEIPDAERWLFRNVPLYERWYRVRLAWIFNDRIYESLHRDPDWPHPERSINAVNDAHRRFFTRYIEDELGDRQDMLGEVLPDYPPFGKRMLLDNGWFRTMTRPDVTLVNDRIERVDETGLHTVDGRHHAADVIVIATGFDVQRFLVPMKIVGRDGIDLDDVWKGDDPRAYLGTAIPGFPNFFCLYGPNTQFGHGGSLIFMLELQMNYVMSLITQMLERGAVSAECRPEVHDSYNERVDELHANMVWTHPGMDVYYRNSAGRVVVNNPFKIVDYWQYVRKADPSDYVLRHAAEEAPA